MKKNRSEKQIILDIKKITGKSDSYDQMIAIVAKYIRKFYELKSKNK